MRYFFISLFVLVLAACAGNNPAPTPEADPNLQVNVGAALANTFNNKGTMVLALPTDFGGVKASRALAVRDGGRILTAVNGVFKDGALSTTLVGLAPDGSPDGTLNNNGLFPVSASARITDLLVDGNDTLHAVGNGSFGDSIAGCGFYLRLAAGKSEPNSVCVSDNRNPIFFAEVDITSSGHVIAAYLTSPTGNLTSLTAAVSSPTPPSPSPFPNPFPDFTPLLTLTRTNPNGTPDLSFGTNGRVVVQASKLEKGLAGMVVLPDNRILVLSNKDGGGVILSRFSANGELEVRQTLTLPDSAPTMNEASFSANALGVDNAGKAVLAGHMFVTTNAGMRYRAALVRLDPSSFQLDGGFGTQGITVSVDSSAFRTFTDLELDSQGRIVSVGMVSSGTTGSFLVERYLKNGKLDTSFGQGGRATIVFDGVTTSQASGVALAKNGNIFVVGQVNVGQANESVGLARLNPKGGTNVNANPGGNPAPDTTSPSILLVRLLSSRHAFTLSPSSEPKGVAKDTNIVITFSEPMNRAATEAAFQSSNSELAASNVTFSWNTESTVLTIDPKKSLEYQKDIAKRYSFNFAQTARDAASNALALSPAFAFTTFRQITQTMPALTNLEANFTWDNLADVIFSGPSHFDVLSVGDYEGTNFSASHRSVLAFNVSNLSATLRREDILSAKLSVFQKDTAGTPYADLGNLLLERVVTGNPLVASDYFASQRSLIAAFAGKDNQVTTLATSNSQLLNAVRVARDTASSKPLQFGLRFERDFNLDRSADGVKLVSSKNISQQPKLEITYLVP